MTSQVPTFPPSSKPLSQTRPPTPPLLRAPKRHRHRHRHHHHQNSSVIPNAKLKQNLRLSTYSTWHMLTISRMRSVLSPCFFKPTINPFALSFHTQNPIFLLSKNMGTINPPSSCFSAYRTKSSIASLKPFKNPSNQIRCLQTEVTSSNPQSSSGEIHVIVGPMFAGKTTTLLKRIKTECSNGRSFALIKSNKDNRYALESVVTHDGEKLPCWPLANLSSFRQKVGQEAYDKLEVIGIDEAQFFEDLYDFCCKAADHDGNTIIVAGLDGGVLDLCLI